MYLRKENLTQIQLLQILQQLPQTAKKTGKEMKYGWVENETVWLSLDKMAQR
jgi:hypothetical protein